MTRRPRCGLSAGRPDGRRAPCGRRRVRVACGAVSNQGAWGPQSTAAKLKTPAGEAGAFGGRAWGKVDRPRNF
jgi:hypothetical protein